MNKKQRELQMKIHNGTLTKKEYKEIDKHLYPFYIRMQLLEKYNTKLYYFIYIIWLVFISTVTSLLVVNFAVK